MAKLIKEKYISRIIFLNSGISVPLSNQALIMGTMEVNLMEVRNTKLQIWLREIFVDCMQFLRILSELQDHKFRHRFSWHRLVSAQFPILYLYTLLLTYWRENLK